MFAERKILEERIKNAIGISPYEVESGTAYSGIMTARIALVQSNPSLYRADDLQMRIVQYARTFTLFVPVWSVEDELALIALLKEHRARSRGQLVMDSTDIISDELYELWKHRFEHPFGEVSLFGRVLDPFLEAIGEETWTSRLRRAKRARPNRSKKGNAPHRSMSGHPRPMDGDSLRDGLDID
jgi:hypothetical protein